MMVEFLQRLIQEHTGIENLKTMEDIAGARKFKEAIRIELIERIQSFSGNQATKEDEDDEFV